MDPKLIEHYAAGGEKLAMAVRGLTREDMLCPPPADANVGRWSIHQVVIHCMDSDLIATDRRVVEILVDLPDDTLVPLLRRFGVTLDFEPPLTGVPDGVAETQQPH